MIKTCGSCENVTKSGEFNFFIFSCSKTGLVVPHESDSETKKVTFFRVPESCPLPVGEVVKSKKAVSKKYLVIKIFSEIN